MIVLDLSILNQKGTPMFNSDIFANRPSFGIVGRIFISTDTKEFFRDTGTSWELIGGPGSGTITGSGTVGTLPIWTTTSALGDSSLIEGATLISTTKDIKADAFYLTGAAASNGALYWTSNRVTLANYNAGGIVHIEVNGGTASTIFGTDLSLTNNGYISAVPTLTAANNASSVAILGVNTLSYAAAFSANNIGAIYGAITGFNLQTFAGNATFANSNVASGGSSVNSIDFSSGGSTITMTQSSGIRVMSGQQNLFQYQGTNSGTITHAAISQNTGFYRPSAATGILTITNAYSLLINALDDYGAGFTFTNRWGIYQAGASDKNYFAANVLIGSTIDSGNKLQVTGAANVTGNARFRSGANWMEFDTNVLTSLNSDGAHIRSVISTDANPTYSYVGDTDTGMFNPSANVLGFSTGGVERARLTNSGNLLVGTTTDGGSRLQVSGSVTATNSGALVGTFNRTTNSGATLAIQVVGSTIGTLGSSTDGNGSFDISSVSGGVSGNNVQISRSGGTATAFFSSTGNVGILTTNPTAALDIPSSTTATATMRIRSGVAPTTPNDGDIWFDGTNLFMRIGGLTKTFTII